MSIAATNPLSGKKPSKQPEAGGSWTDVFRTAFCVILGILSFTHSFFAFAFFALQMFCVCCGQVVLFVVRKTEAARVKLMSVSDETIEKVSVTV